MGVTESRLKEGGKVSVGSRGSVAMGVVREGVAVAKTGGGVPEIVVGDSVCGGETVGVSLWA